MSSEIFQAEKKDDVLIVSLTINDTFYVDTQTLMKELEELIDKGNKKIILDCAQVIYISSLILASLVYIHKKSQDAGGKLVFCSIQERVIKIISMTSLDKVFTIVKTKEEALELMTKKK